MRSAVGVIQRLFRPSGRFVRRLTHKNLSAHLMLLAVVLSFPSLWAGWAADDHHHRLRFTASDRFPQVFAEDANPLLDLFIFADGDPRRMHRLMDVGFWPWWTLPELRAAFLRPVTNVTHWIDYQFWPNKPAAMHLQSILWFAALIGAVSLLYRRLIGNQWVAGLAALLYAVDDAHALPAAWLANRNSLLAALFGVLAVLAHIKWRRERWSIGLVIGPLLLMLSLLSKEAGIATCAYLLAYALFLDQGTWRQRFVSLIPYGIVVMGWRMVWTHMGFGIWGMNIYVDPLTEPLRYLGAVIQRVPIYLASQWLLPPADLALLCVDFGILIYCWVMTLVIVVAVFAIMIRHVRWDPVAKFWFAGMLFALFPICTVFPGDRVMCFVGIGAFGLIANFLAGASEQPSVENYSRRRPARILAKVFVGVHLVLAPIVLTVHAAMPLGPQSLLESLEVRVPMGAEVERQSVIIVTAPIPIIAGYMAERHAIDGLPIPAHTRVLAPSQSRAASVYRPDERTLVVRLPEGFLKRSFDQLTRSLEHPMFVGQRVELTGMVAEVGTLTSDGRPDQVSFTFDVPLEDPSLRWLWWNDGGFAPFVPPPVGATVELLQGSGNS